MCGAVNDGKATLLGRLLRDSRTVLEDRSSTVETESWIWGAQGDATGIACRYFKTDKRKFVAMGVSGHEQDIRNLAIGVSNADLALIVVDARKGISTQTRQHSHFVSLLGVRQTILAVNKMDLVGYEQDVFMSIADEYGEFVQGLGIEDFSAVPLSAQRGENIFTRLGGTPWYGDRTLMELLETAELGAEGEKAHFGCPSSRLVAQARKFEASAER